MEYSIGITTFPRRFEAFKNLVEQIRKYTDADIIVQANQFNKIKDVAYTKNILSFCSSVDNLYITVYPEFTSLAKMWNTIVINSSTDNVLMLNDDVYIENVFASIDSLSKTYSGLTIINNSWSHYLISKNMLNFLGYFDERLLTYGEEDGDMVWRYIDKFKSYPPIFNLSGIYNLAEGYGIIPPNLKWFDAGNVIRPLFNREFCFGEKYSPNQNGHRGMFDCNRILKISNEKQYPYEEFKMKHKDNI